MNGRTIRKVGPSFSRFPLASGPSSPVFSTAGCYFGRGGLTMRERVIIRLLLREWAR